MNAKYMFTTVFPYPGGYIPTQPQQMPQTVDHAKPQYSVFPYTYPPVLLTNSSEKTNKTGKEFFFFTKKLSQVITLTEKNSIYKKNLINLQIFFPKKDLLMKQIEKVTSFTRTE